MKCPYQIRMIHKSENNGFYVREPAEDITMFSDCLKTECPFYYVTECITEHCRRAESEVQK